MLPSFLVFVVLAHAGVLASLDPDAYYQSVQEDEYLEWGTFWAFAGAAVCWAWAMVRQLRAGRRVPWYFAGLSLFCVFVALEEISWGQRIFGYRPPVYFLENNFQLELNLHNIVETAWRKRALVAVIAGYGIALPMLALLPAPRRWLASLGIVAPAPSLIPGFALTLGLYLEYPWSHSGESVELMLGLGFLFASLSPFGDSSEARPARRPGARLTAGAWAGVIALGFVSAELSRDQRRADPSNVAAAEFETQELAQDFLRPSKRRGLVPVTRCDLHKRVYSYVEKYRNEAMRRGRFAQLSQQGMASERAEFFLDPWNSPYWIRHWCDDHIDYAFVYSFGPNRVRDSSRSEILGDDIGVTLIGGESE